MFALIRAKWRNCVYFITFKGAKKPLFVGGCFLELVSSNDLK